MSGSAGEADGVTSPAGEPAAAHVATDGAGTAQPPGSGLMVSVGERGGFAVPRQLAGRTVRH